MRALDRRRLHSGTRWRTFEPSETSLVHGSYATMIAGESEPAGPVEWLIFHHQVVNLSTITRPVLRRSTAMSARPSKPPSTTRPSSWWSGPDNRARRRSAASSPSPEAPGRSRSKSSRGRMQTGPRESFLLPDHSERTVRSSVAPPVNHSSRYRRDCHRSCRHHCKRAARRKTRARLWCRQISGCCGSLRCRPTARRA